MSTALYGKERGRCRFEIQGNFETSSRSVTIEELFGRHFIVDYYEEGRHFDAPYSDKRRLHPFTIVVNFVLDRLQYAFNRLGEDATMESHRYFPYS